MPDGISRDSRVFSRRRSDAVEADDSDYNALPVAPALLDGQAADTSQLQRSKGDLMGNDRNRTDEQFTGPASERESEPREERIRNGIGEDVRGVADEEDEDFEDLEDMADDDSDGSF